MMEIGNSTFSEHSISYRTLFAAMLCFYAGIMLWLGSVAFFGIGVAPVIFKVLPSKDLAGALNSVILHRLNMLELVGATLIGIAMALLFSLRNQWRYTVALGLLLLMIALWAGYALGITAKMNILRSQVNSFDTPDGASILLIQEFRGYHQWYSRLVVANLFVGMCLLIWQTRMFLTMMPTFKEK